MADFEKIKPLYGADYEKERRKAAPPADAPASAPDPIAGMPRLPSPFDIPVVADFAEGVFGRSPLGALRNLASEATGGKIPTQQEKTAAAQQRSPVATGSGRVFSDVVTGSILKPFGMFAAGAAPEVIDATVNKKLFNTDQKPIDWQQVAHTAARATLGGVGAKALGDPSAVLRAAGVVYPPARLASQLMPNIPALNPSAAFAPVPGLLESFTQLGTDRERAASAERRKRGAK